MLKERIAVITGASRGIGRAIAIELAQSGANVVLASRSEDELQTVSDEISALGGNSIAVRTDVSKVEDVKNLMAKCNETFGQPDILVNNAGAIARATVHQMDVAEWDEIIGVNQRGTFLCTKYALGGMFQKKKGDIFIISSIRARKGVATRSAYCSSKAALCLFGQSLREEVREQNIRVHTFILAGVDTPMIRTSHPETDPSIWIEAKNVGRMVVYCASLPDIVDTPEIEFRSLSSGD